MEWQQTFDAIESPLLILDSRGRIIKSNDAATTMTRRTRDELIGLTLADLDGCPLWRKAEEVVEMARERPVAAAAQIQDQSCGHTWELVANPATVPGTGEARIILVIRDVTRMVELQASLHRSETMSLLGSLISGVAHEVRNPLFGISSTLDAFEARFDFNEEYEPYISVLRGEVDRLNHLMKDLLDYGRPLSHELATGSAAEAVSKAVQACMLLAQQGGVEIVNRVRAELPHIRLAPKRLPQAFLNLLENAIYHSSPGGRVTIEGEVIRQNGSPWVVLSIKDAGAGFREEDLPHLFEPFFTRRRGGTGLGLSIVQKIVEAHGGMLYAANREEGGAVVEIRFPAADAQVTGKGGSDGEEQDFTYRG
ncbi:MAG: sensor histidine kinase [Blastocatellia bacterium]